MVTKIGVVFALLLVGVGGACSPGAPSLSDGGFMTPDSGQTSFDAGADANTEFAALCEEWIPLLRDRKDGGTNDAGLVSCEDQPQLFARWVAHVAAVYQRCNTTSDCFVFQPIVTCGDLGTGNRGCGIALGRGESCAFVAALKANAPDVCNARTPAGCFPIPGCPQRTLDCFEGQCQMIEP